MPACQLPSPFIASACAAVMVTRLCVSARLADSLANCELRCVYTVSILTLPRSFPSLVVLWKFPSLFVLLPPACPCSSHGSSPSLSEA